MIRKLIRASQSVDRSIDLPISNRNYRAKLIASPAVFRQINRPSYGTAVAGGVRPGDD